MKPIRLSSQVSLLAIALLLWAIWPRTEFWTLPTTYLAAWLLLHGLPREWGFPAGRALTVSIARLPFFGLLLIVLAAPVAVLLRHAPEVPWSEGLRGVTRHTADRIRLEALPAVAPAVVFDDHPQRFYIHAVAAADVVVELGPGVEPLAAEELGHGLYRAHYDPRVQGVPAGDGDSVTARVVVNGKAVSRRLARVRPLAHPRRAAADPARGLGCAVSEETDELFLVSRTGLQHRVPVADGPVDCAWFQGRVAVAHRYTPELWWIDGETGEVVERRPAPRFAHRLAVDAEGGRLAMATTGAEPALHLWRFSTARDIPWQVAGNLTLEFEPDVPVLVPDALVVSSASERALFRVPSTLFEGGTGEMKALYLGRPAVTLAVSPPRSGESRLYAAVTDYRPDGEVHQGNHFLQDQILTIDPTTLEVVGQYLTARRSPVQTEAGSVDQGISPMGIAVPADGSLRVVFAGSDEAWHLRLEETEMPRILDGYDFDLISPYGVADLGTEGGESYWFATSPAAGALAVYRGQEMVVFEGVTPPDDKLAAAPPGTQDWLALELRVGERAFNETTRSGISCQSCHLHGGTDHSPHDIGQASLLHTLTTRGLARTAPYLRDASYPRVRDLNDHLAQTLFRGYERYLPGRARALEAYVESLPRRANPHWWAQKTETKEDAKWVAPLDAKWVAPFPDEVQELEKKGVEVFVGAGCRLCHTFPAFTNLAQHPRGSLFPEMEEPGGILDTPSLLGLWDKHHLLQDGRALGFRAVLEEHNPADRHGATATLSEADKDALIRFLEAL